MKFLGSTKSKIAKDKNGENVPYLEINEGVLIHCNAVNNVIILLSTEFKSLVYVCS